jgi:hypothetical protein
MSIRRTLFAAAVIAASGLSLFSPSQARADVDVNLYVGPPVGFWPGWAPGRRWITCAEGARLVSYRGFNRVSIVECNRPYYRYQARRGGIWYIVRVDARLARIRSARPI